MRRLLLPHFTCVGILLFCQSFSFGQVTPIEEIRPFYGGSWHWLNAHLENQAVDGDNQKRDRYETRYTRSGVDYDPGNLLSTAEIVGTGHGLEVKTTYGQATLPIDYDKTLNVTGTETAESSVSLEVSPTLNTNDKLTKIVFIAASESSIQGSNNITWTNSNAVAHFFFKVDNPVELKLSGSMMADHEGTSASFNNLVMKQSDDDDTFSPSGGPIIHYSGKNVITVRGIDSSFTETVELIHDNFNDGTTMEIADTILLVAGEYELNFQTRTTMKGTASVNSMNASANLTAEFLPTDFAQWLHKTPPEDGAFSTSSNWSSDIPPSLTATKGSALFTGEGPYEVTFSSNITNHTLLIETKPDPEALEDLNGLNLKLNDRTYTLNGRQGSSDPAIVIGAKANGQSALTVTDGKIETGKDVVIANRASTTGSLKLENADMTVGSSGTGKLQVGSISGATGKLSMDAESEVRMGNIEIGNFSEVNVDQTKFIFVGTNPPEGDILFFGIDNKPFLIREKIHLFAGGTLNSGAALMVGGSNNKSHVIIEGNNSEWSIGANNIINKEWLIGQQLPDDDFKAGSLLLSGPGQGAFLEIRDGGKVEMDDFTAIMNVGYPDVQSKGEVRISGKSSENNPSTLKLSGFLYVGDGGIGKVTVEDGGVLSTDFLNVGEGNGSRGLVTVQGQGSRLDITHGPITPIPDAPSNLIIGGDNGAGILQIIDHATGSEDVDVSGDGGLGNGVEVLNSGLLIVSNNASFTANIIGVDSGGKIFIEDGGTITSGFIQVESGAFIFGDGKLDVSVGGLFNSGFIQPGLSPGVLQIIGDYEQSPTGTLEIEISGLTSGSEYDVLDVSGDVNLSGTIALTFLDGFLPSQGEVFDFLPVGGTTSGEFSTIEVRGVKSTWDFEFGTDPEGALTLRSNNDAEPGGGYIIGEGLDDFETFQSENFTPEEIASGDADPYSDYDDDGIETLMEQFLGTDPTQSDSIAPLFKIQYLANGNLEISFIESTLIEKETILETNNNLGQGWVPISDSDYIRTSSPHPDLESVELVALEIINPDWHPVDKRFFRIVFNHL